MKFSLFALVLSACGGGNNAQIDAHKTADARLVDGSVDAALGANVVHGTVGGSTFNAADAMFKNTTADGFDFSGPSTVVEMTSFTNACALQTSNTGSANGHLLIFVLGETDGAGGSSPAADPGVYAVFSGTPAPDAMLAEVYWEIDGPDCLKSDQATAISGTVTVTSASDPQRGTFDVMFPNNEHVTGSYAAPSCAGLDPNRTPLGGC